jgi:hypothetical protein
MGEMGGNEDESEKKLGEKGCNDIKSIKLFL